MLKKVVSFDYLVAESYKGIDVVGWRETWGKSNKQIGTGYLMLD